MPRLTSWWPKVAGAMESASFGESRKKSGIDSATKVFLQMRIHTMSLCTKPITKFDREI
jgi:hypothetical protein